ncbi:MAG: DUF835 domain-containing protein [Thermoplasmata archaeon]|nr:DUF835 domain-containing protein [Thermoplasmata archaeon]
MAIPFVVLAAFSLLLLNDDDTAAAIDLTVPALAAVATVFIALLWHRSRNPLFRSTGVWFAAAFGLLTAGWIWYTLQSRIDGEITGLSMSDGLWIGGYLVLAYALFLTVVTIKVEISKGIVATEAVYGILIIALVSYSIYLSVEEAGLTTEVITYSAYPVLDIVVLGLLILVMWYLRKGQLSDFWLILTVSASFWMAGDITYLLDSAAGTYAVGSNPDLLFLCNYGLMALGMGMLVAAQRRGTPSSKPEKGVGIGGSRKFEAGTVYLFWDETPDRALKATIGGIGEGLEGLIISRRSPADMTARFGLKRTPMLWITTVPGPDHVNPSNLGILSDRIARFVERGTNSVVFLDGFETLVTHNDPKKAMQTLDRVKDIVRAHGSRLVITMDRRTVADKDAALIESNAEKA